MNRLFRYASILVIVATAAACSQTEPAKGRIGMTCMDLTNPFFKLIANVMEEEAAKHGYELVSLDGRTDPATQNNQLADFVAQDFDAIFLNPTDSKAVGEGVKRAHDAGIPVFTFDVQVNDDVARDLIVSHIGSDNYQGGELAADSMIEATGDQGEIAIVSFPEVTSCILRVRGFEDRLEAADSGLEIVTELSGRGSREGGYATATDILQAHPNIAGIFAINDPSALGAHSAVVKAGLEDQVTIIAFDASPAGKQAVYEKILYDTPQQFPRKMAVGTVEAYLSYLRGEDVPKQIFIPCEHYTYETAVNDESREQQQW